MPRPAGSWSVQQFATTTSSVADNWATPVGCQPVCLLTALSLYGWPTVCWTLTYTLLAW